MQPPRPPLSQAPLQLNGKLYSELSLVRARHARGQPGLTLAEFVVAAWPVLEPSTPLAWNWHLDAMCEHLEALVLNRMGPAGQSCPQNLLVNVPPGSMKSLVFAVFMPAWVWLFRPAWRALYASGTPSVVTRDSLKCRTLIRSDWYQQTFVPSWKIAADQDEKQHFANSAGGFRKGLGAGAAVTGERADFLGTDDPNDAREIHSKAHRDNVNEKWWSNAWHNRIADPTTSKRAVIMQRLHEEDLAGYVLAKEPNQWAHLCIRMEFEGVEPPTWLGWADPRRTQGELLFPERFTPAYLAAEKVALGSSGYVGQMQQRPSNSEGNRFKREWWRFYTPLGGPAGLRPKGCNDLPSVALPRQFEEVIASWDCTFKDSADSDFVAGGVIARVGAHKYVRAVYCERAGFVETQRAIAKQAAEWRPSEILIEDKANGSAVIETLSTAIAGIIGVEPKGGKEARAAAIEPQVEAGQVFLPEGAEWVEAFVEQFAAFPKGKNDDMVDMLSQALLRLEEDSDVRVTKALLGMR